MWMVDIITKVFDACKRLRSHMFMAPHLRFGARGERIARLILERCGMEYLTGNFRIPGGEIDLIFRDGEELCFIEVKTRHRSLYAPEAAVNREKKLRISRTASRYMRICGLRGVKCRCDIVEVIFDGDSLAEVHHYRDAFRLLCKKDYL